MAEFLSQTITGRDLVVGSSTHPDQWPNACVEYLQVAEGEVGYDHIVDSVVRISCTDWNSFGLDTSRITHAAETFLADLDYCVHDRSRANFVMTASNFNRLVYALLVTPELYGAAVVHGWGWAATVGEGIEVPVEHVRTGFVDMAQTDTQPDHEWEQKVTRFIQDVALQIAQEGLRREHGYFDITVERLLEFVKDIDQEDRQYKALDGAGVISVLAKLDPQTSVEQLQEALEGKRVENSHKIVGMVNGILVRQLRANIDATIQEDLDIRTTKVIERLEQQLIVEHRQPRFNNEGVPIGDECMNSTNWARFTAKVGTRREKQGVRTRLTLPEDTFDSQQGEQDGLIVRMVDALRIEENSLFTKEWFDALTQSTYRRIVPISPQAPIGRDLTEEEYAALPSKQQALYEEITMRRECNITWEQLDSLNRRVRWCIEHDEALVVFNPACPANPYVVEFRSDGAYNFVPVPNRGLIAEGMNHTGFTAMHFMIPVLQHLFAAGVAVEMHVGTGAEEYEQGRTRGMTRDIFRKDLNGNHAYTIKTYAHALGQQINNNAVTRGALVDHIQPHHAALHANQLHMHVDALMGLAGGQEAWEQLEQRAAGMRDRFWKSAENAGLINRVAQARWNFYSFILATRYGIIKERGQDEVPTSEENAAYLREHYRGVIAQRQSINPDDVTENQVEKTYSTEVLEELKSDVLYYCTFHLMALEGWGRHRLTILAADSRPLHTLAAEIIGTWELLLTPAGMYRGADFTDT